MHFVDVGLRMIRIGVLVCEAKACGEQLPNGGLAGARHAHDDDCRNTRKSGAPMCRYGMGIRRRGSLVQHPDGFAGQSGRARRRQVLLQWSAAAKRECWAKAW